MNIPTKIKKIFDGNKNVQQVAITFFDNSMALYWREQVNGEIKESMVL